MNRPRSGTTRGVSRVQPAAATTAAGRTDTSTAAGRTDTSTAAGKPGTSGTDRARRAAASGATPRSLRAVAQALGRSFPGSDLALWAAGATFFGILGLVPLALVSLRLAGALSGPEFVAARMDTAISGLPAGHGTPQALRTLTATALGMSWVQTLVALFPASIYGEGLRRAFRQLGPEPDRFTGWRGRLGLLFLAVPAPALVLVVLAASPLVAPLYAAGGRSLVLGIVIDFHVVWVALSPAVVLVYRFVAPGRRRWPALLWGGFGTGAVLAGFLQGFLLFLALPVDWALPFGGLPVFGAVAALAVWLYLLHLVLLAGYRLTLVLDDGALPRALGGRPARPPDRSRSFR